MKLFLYGVLQRNLASPAIARLLEGLGEGEPASAAGTLYAVPDARGWYPVLVPGDGRVHGTLCDAGTVDLAALDVFEGIEHRRSPILATPSGREAVRAEAYLYQFAPRPDFLPIEHGDFARWLRETGRTALSG